MPSTPNKKEKIAKLVKDWNSKYSKMTFIEIGKEFGVSYRTIGTWRAELQARGVNLPLGRKQLGTSDIEIFDSFAKKS